MSQGRLFGESSDNPVVYFGRNPTATEAIAGTAVHEDREPHKPLRPGKKGHLTLRAFAALTRGSRPPERRWTAYEVSRALCGDGHGARREIPRLLERGFVRKEGTKTNVGVVVNGRPHVDAYVLTNEGWAELRRLDAA